MSTLHALGLLAPLIIFALLLLVGLICGRLVERRHYASIIERESRPGQVMIFPSRTPPPEVPVIDMQLVSGSVVVSVDYFKRFIAGLRMLIGGRLNTHEALLDRARREALLRMRDEAAALGANLVFNVRLETAAIAGRVQRQGTGSVEVLAYGTALIPAQRR
jgi:uncharacterized protein YbjQ (UPF0145 family)